VPSWRRYGCGRMGSVPLLPGVLSRACRLCVCVQSTTLFESWGAVLEFQPLIVEQILHDSLQYLEQQIEAFRELLRLREKAVKVGLPRIMLRQWQELRGGRSFPSCRRRASWSESWRT
jgi:hypothetical protein